MAHAARSYVIFDTFLWRLATAAIHVHVAFNTLPPAAMCA
jgi:hypothetical protein